MSLIWTSTDTSQELQQSQEQCSVREREIPWVKRSIPIITREWENYSISQDGCVPRSRMP
eukprot:13762270-Ditylum_brightwellii.AAC.1